MAVSIQQVKKTLQENNFDLGSLCTSQNINKWSFWKPINLAKNEGITDSDLFLKNDGFINIIFKTPADVVKGYDTRWQYERPVNCYRLGDFRNYDHNATKWYNLEVTSLDYGAVGDPIHFSLDKELVFLKDFELFKQIYNTLDFGFILVKDTFSQYCKVGSILDIEEDKLSLIIPEGLPLGIYKCIPVLTDNLNTWITLPSDMVQFTVQTEPQFNPFKYIQFIYRDGNYSYNEQFIFDLVFNSDIKISKEYSGTPISMTVDIIYENADVSGKVQDILINSQSYADLMAGDMRSYEVIHTDNIYYLGGKIEERIPLKVNYSLTIGGHSFYKDEIIFINTS